MNRAIKIICAFMLVAVLVLLSLHDTLACSCDRISREEGISLAQNVFEGRVISVRPMAEGERIPKSSYFGASSHGLVTRFQVLKSVKGNLAGEVDIYSASMGSMCGLNYTAHIGTELTVGTQPESAPDNVTSLCLDRALNPEDLVLQRRFKGFAPIDLSEIRVIDGNTIRISGMKADTRLAGFNAADFRQAMCSAEKALGEKAWQKLRKLRAEGNLEFQFVACSCPAGIEGKENCGSDRSCGTLKSNGRDVGEILIQENLAVPFRCETTSCSRTPRPWCE